MDVYRSLAAIINSSAAASTDPITLIASQLSGAAPAQKPELSRILAELLRSQSTPDAAAQKTLHDYIRSLVSSVNADDASQDFKLAVELADEGLLLQILGETVKMLEGLLVHAKAMHVSSDDAFAVLFDVFFEKHVEFSGEALEQDGLRDAVVSRLRFWHFLFMIEGARDQAAHQELFQRFAQALPARLLGAMALRDDVVAKAASNVLCCFVNDFHQSLPAGASEVLFTPVASSVCFDNRIIAFHDADVGPLL